MREIKLLYFVILIFLMFSCSSNTETILPEKNYSFEPISFERLDSQSNPTPFFPFPKLDNGLVFITDHTRMIQIGNYSNGIPNGMGILFHDNGMVSEIHNYEDGVLDDDLYIYDDSGTLELYAFYDEDTLVLTAHYDQNEATDIFGFHGYINFLTEQVAVNDTFTLQFVFGSPPLVSHELKIFVFKENELLDSIIYVNQKYPFVFPYVFKEPGAYSIHSTSIFKYSGKEHRVPSRQVDVLVYRHPVPQGL